MFLGRTDRSMRRTVRDRNNHPELSLIYDTVIRPFIEPFIEITFHTLPKLFVSGIVLVVMVIGTILDLIDTPEVLWVGLFLLATLDFVAGTSRAIFDADIKFSFRRWARTAYKLTSYTIVILTTSVAGNMYPKIFGWIQYLVIALLVGLEIVSVARHIKMTAVLFAIIELAKSNKQNAPQNFMAAVDKLDKDLRDRKIEREKRRQDTDKANDPPETIL